MAKWESRMKKMTNEKTNIAYELETTQIFNRCYVVLEKVSITANFDIYNKKL